MDNIVSFYLTDWGSSPHNLIRFYRRNLENFSILVKTLGFKSHKGSNMSNFPKSGQWWQSIYGTRVYIIGVKLNGDVMYQAKNLAGYNGGSDWDDWQHLPDCDSFDWSPWTLEVWPKYYLPTMCSFSRAFYRRDSETETVGVGHTGTEFAWTGG